MTKKANRNIYWIIAGTINLFTALLHTIGGQIDLVNHQMDSNLDTQSKTEWLGVWHMVTVILFVSSYYLLKNGFNYSEGNSSSIHLIGILYLLFSTSFILCSLSMRVFAPQWILLLPIGILSIIRTKRES